MREQGDGHEREAQESAHQPGQPPVIENPLLPTMPASEAIKPGKLDRTTGNRMEVKPGGDSGGHARMAPTPKAGVRTKAPIAAGKTPKFPDQRRPGGPDVAQSGLSYVRLRLHFEGGRLNIVGAKEVPGPLTIPDYVGTGLVYEILAANRRVGLGSLPDVNVRRAFTNFDQKEAALGHNPTVLDSYDFDVRLPRSELSVNALPSIVINLHQVDFAPTERLGRQSLTTQFGDAAKTVASLSGINLGEMDSTAQAEVANILRLDVTGA